MSASVVVPQEGQLLEEVVWHLEVLTPLHVGSGEKLQLGLDVESDGELTYVLDMDRLYEVLEKTGQHEQLGEVPVRSLYSGPLDKVKRYALAGKMEGQRFGVSGSVAELRAFTRDGFGRPFLPGSSLKGALRTALLNALADTKEDVRDQLKRRGGGRKTADDRAEKAAFYCDSSRAATATSDVLRHLYVPDVFVPASCMEVVAVKIASMAGEATKQWGWKSGKRNNNVRLPKDEGVLTLFVEALRAGTVLRVPLRVDRRLMTPDWLKEAPEGPRQDFSAWLELLTTGLLPAVQKHGQGVLMPEAALWRERPVGTVGRQVNAVCKRSDNHDGVAVFPVGWGIGWRGMTGGLLERLDGDTSRERSANSADPAMLKTARNDYSTKENRGKDKPEKKNLGMGRKDFGIFPKSRRVALDKSGEPAVPMGWVAVRRWLQGDAKTPLGELAPPRPKVGDIVEVRLLPERSKKGKWRAEIAGGVTGVFDGTGLEPEGLVAGVCVRARVRATSTNNDWTLGWLDGGSGRR